MGWAEALVKVIFWPRVRKAKRIGKAAELIGEGRAEETLEILDKMERRIPPYLGYLFFLTKARALDELGRLDEAEQTYTAAVFSKEGASNAYVHLAVLCGRQRRFDDCRDWLRRVREDAEAEPELLEQTEEIEKILDDVVSGRRLQEMQERAGRFAAERGVAELDPRQALSTLERWVAGDLEAATEQRDDLACLLGELAVRELRGSWRVSLSLEESAVEVGEGALNPFDWVAARLAGETSIGDFPPPRTRRMTEPSTGE